jgi:hypothetical protein
LTATPLGSDGTGLVIHSPNFRTIIKPFLSQRVRINFAVDFNNWGSTIKPSGLKQLDAA